MQKGARAICIIDVSILELPKQKWTGVAPVCLSTNSDGNLVTPHGNDRTTAATRCRLCQIVRISRLSGSAGVSASIVGRGAMISRFGHGRMSQQNTTGSTDLGRDGGLRRVFSAKEDQRALTGIVLVVSIDVVLDDKGDAVHRTSEVV